MVRNLTIDDLKKFMYFIIFYTGFVIFDQLYIDLFESIWQGEMIETIITGVTAFVVWYLFFNKKSSK